MEHKLSNKNKWITDNHNSINESHRYHTERKKANHKTAQIVQSHLYTKLKRGDNSSLLEVIKNNQGDHDRDTMS